ncbi:DUF971 domain-containing protein [Ilumatobacter sp.]|uniref:DUF971 domain-containing protein n=1 Tax=Ilumatobacter sp. TaxID=1967498 RepID=UPI003AF471C8
MARAQVIDIELERERELRVVYDDGVTCAFPLLELRRACPCATCRGRRDADQPAYGGAVISALGAELQGNWGISIEWSDGHSTGIYPWDHLRAWWDAGLDGEYARRE